MLGYRGIAHSLQTSAAEKLELFAKTIQFGLHQELQRLIHRVGAIVDSRALEIYMQDFDDRPLLGELGEHNFDFGRISILGETGKEEINYTNGTMKQAFGSYQYHEGYLDALWIPNNTVVRFEPKASDVPAKVVFFRVKQNFFDEFAGGVRASVTLNSLFQRILTSTMDAFVIVVGPDKQIAFLRNADPWLGPEALRLQCDGDIQGTAGFSQCNGTSVYGLRVPLANDGWVLMVGVLKSELEAPVVSTRNSLVAVLLVLVAGVIVVSFWFARTIQKPLSKLVVASRQLAGGARGVEVDIQRSDEFGELGLAFNDMSQSLQVANEERDRAMNELAEMNRELGARLADLNYAHERIEYMAYNDELTGLANRRLMFNRLEQALSSGVRHGKRGALIMLDLDRFKNINDSLGHAAGDRLLKQVGERLQGVVRVEDTVCRLGGDEFVVLLPSVENEGDDVLSSITHAADKIRRTLGEPYQLDHGRYQATPSIGVIVFPHMDDKAEDLLKRADAAMYRAKQEGGNKVAFYEKAMQVAADERLHLEKDLQHAFAQRDLFLSYQQQCDVEGNVVGIEALVRWQHPERGMVPPPQFIGIAEETGMIGALGAWILEQACHDMVPLLKSGNLIPSTTFTVNVSARQFRDPNFGNAVLYALDRYQVPRGRLKLELTETALLDNIESTIERMNALREAGVLFSLDDFGTGYSSLAYLSRLPLDELKIDRSFIVSAEQDQGAWSIVEAIIDVARSLGLTVVAEGVEKQSELDRLRTIGCPVYQGYYFSRPLVIEQLYRDLAEKIGFNTTFPPDVAVSSSR